MSGRLEPFPGRIVGRGASAPLPFLSGANYPWGMWEGKSNYGCDFGRNRWGSHTGVSRQAGRVEADFRTLREMGLDVVRWFVFCDGRAGVRFGPGGEVVGADVLVAADLDAAIAAARFSGVRLILVLMDYLWVVHRGPAALEPRLVERLFGPLFRRYGRCREVLAWELMNEPDWVVEGMSPDPGRVQKPVGMEAFRRVLAVAADAVHGETVGLFTLGTCRARHLGLFEGMDLDFLQVHPYADFQGGAEEDRIGGRSAKELGGGVPVLVGEYPLGVEGSEGFVQRVRGAGFAGALFWSYNPVDRFGIPVADALRAAVLESGISSNRS